MLSWYQILILLVLGFSLTASSRFPWIRDGVPTLISQSEDCRCQANVADEHEVPMRFNFGWYASMCIDSCRFRASQILKERRNLVRVSNVYHQNAFWMADFYKDNLERVELLLEEFLPGIWHVALHFRMKKPVRLERQGERKPGERPAVTEVKEIVMSPEGVPPAGLAYNFFESSMERYLFAYRLMSGEAAYEWMVKNHDHPTALYRLDLTSEQVERLFEESVAASEKMSFRQVYRLFHYNCSTAAFDLIDSVLNSERPWWETNLASFERIFPVNLPVGLLANLQRQGLASYEARPFQMADYPNFTRIGRKSRAL